MARKENKVKAILNSKFVRKHKKICLCLIVCLCFLGLFLTVNYGRYVKNIIEVYYLRTQNFYFSSDKLTINGKTYEIEPWGGLLDHTINISMSSLLNSLKGTTVDIEYELSCESDGKVDCFVNEERESVDGRVISADGNADNFVITVSSKSDVELKDGDKVKIKVIAKSTYPYEEELSATFILIVGNYGVEYVIEDNPGDVYFDAIITNAFDTDLATITLTISDMDLVSFDMSNKILNSDSIIIGKELVSVGNNQYEYIKTITFDLEPKSSMMVRYFKTDVTADYSYQTGDPTPIVTFVGKKKE